MTYDHVKLETISQKLICDCITKGEELDGISALCLRDVILKGIVLFFIINQMNEFFKKNCFQISNSIPQPKFILKLSVNNQLYREGEFKGKKRS